jgi:thioredoxin reductase (NADPH)
MESKVYDVLIIGGGPAGLTAALYAVRAGLSALVLEGMAAGGQMALTAQIDNYPGFDDGIDGFTLGTKMQKGAKKFGAEFASGRVDGFELDGDIKRVTTKKGEYLGRTVILAMGAQHKHLGANGEDEFGGRGVSYCATCDGMLYRNKTVAVIGGGNTAAGDALLLSRICQKVYLIHRRDSLRADKIYVSQLEQTANVEILWNTTITQFYGDERLGGVKISTLGKERELPLDGAFVSVGMQPQTAALLGNVKLDESGYIIAGEDTKTNLKGVFAVGDIRTKQVRQVVTAAADGAVAIHFVEEYLR